MGNVLLQKKIFVVQENNKSEWAYPGKKSFVDFKMSFISLHNLAEYEWLIFKFILNEVPKIELNKKLYVAI